MIPALNLLCAAMIAIWLVKWRVIAGALVWLSRSGDKYRGELNRKKTLNGEILLRTIRDHGGGANWPWGVMDCNLRLRLIGLRKDNRLWAARFGGFAYALFFRLPWLCLLTTLLVLVALNQRPPLGPPTTWLVSSMALMAMVGCDLVIAETILSFTGLGYYATALHMLEVKPATKSLPVIELKVFILLATTTIVATSVVVATFSTYLGSFSLQENYFIFPENSPFLMSVVRAIYGVLAFHVRLGEVSHPPADWTGYLLVVFAAVQAAFLFGVAGKLALAVRNRSAK